MLYISSHNTKILVTKLKKIDCYICKPPIPEKIVYKKTAHDRQKTYYGQFYNYSYTKF